jgi:hypothetical protein
MKQGKFKINVDSLDPALLLTDVVAAPFSHHRSGRCPIDSTHSGNVRMFCALSW